MIESLRKIIPRSLGKSPAAKRLRAALIIDKANTAAEELFGKKIAAHIKVASFRAGRLRIVCDRSVYAQEVQLHETELRNRINALLGSDDVKRVLAGG